jgi:hypothetical protein
MDSSNKIKIQIGDFHLETEGSEEAIEKRLSVFKELVEIASKAGVSAEHSSRRSHSTESKDGSEKQGSAGRSEPSSPLRRLFRVDDRVITLEAMPNGGSRDGDAFLLLLLGHKIMRGESLVLVSDLLQGLKNSGVSVDRIDTVTAIVASELWNKVGQRRAGKFRLTVPGEKKAREMAETLVNQMV